MSNAALELIQEKINSGNEQLENLKKYHEQTISELEKEAVEINKLKTRIQELETAKEHLEQVL